MVGHKWIPGVDVGLFHESRGSLGFTGIPLAHVLMGFCNFFFYSYMSFIWTPGDYAPFSFNDGKPSEEASNTPEQGQCLVAEGRKSIPAVGTC